MHADSEQLATQMFASLRYIQTHHSYAHIEGQPDQNPYTNGNSQSGGAGDAQATDGAVADGANQLSLGAVKDEGPTPDSTEVFQASLRELARDLILKEQQIEYLITVLPGIDNSERDQNDRIHALEKELRQIEEERKTAMRSKEDMLGVLSELAANCKRVY